MATRGVYQLQKLTLYYCEHGGSSESIRHVVSSGRLSEWALQHPHVNIHVMRRNGKHPFVEALYINHKVHQVDVKNQSAHRIMNVCDMLHNRSGRKIKKITKDVVTHTPSIQGVWTPFLNLNETPAFAIEFVPQVQRRRQLPHRTASVSAGVESNNSNINNNNTEL